MHGKKLIGSAQARRKNGVLQHGSLPLRGDLTRITQVLAFPHDQERKEAGDRLLLHAITLEAVLGYRIEWQTAAQAFIQSFQSELNLEFVRNDLSELEIERTTQLVKEKYAYSSWLKRI